MPRLRASTVAADVHIAAEGLTVLAAGGVLYW